MGTMSYTTIVVPKWIYCAIGSRGVLRSTPPGISKVRYYEDRLPQPWKKPR